MANLGVGVVGFCHADDAGIPAAPIVEAGEVWRLIDDNQVLVLVEDQIREFWSLGSTGYGLTHAYKGTKMGWEVESVCFAPALAIIGTLASGVLYAPAVRVK